MLQSIEQLLQRKMNRKEFLAALGLGAVTIMGFSNLLKVLGHDPHKRQIGTSSGSSYGGSSYGGRKR
jgi:hypothetical protein